MSFIFFIILAILITAIALLLMWPRTTKFATSQTPVPLYQDQLAELGQSYVQGHLSAGDYAEAKEEIHRRLLEEAQEPMTLPSSSPKQIKILKAALVAPVILAVALYAWLGRADLLLTPPTAEELAKKLEANLASATPDQWVRLAHLQMAEEHNAQAVLAFEKAEVKNLREDDLASYLAALIKSGIGAHEAGQYQEAISYWQRALAFVPAGSQEAELINSGIARATQDQARQNGLDSPIASGTLRIKLLKSALKNITDAAVVFIFIQGNEGGPPLAAMKLSAGKNSQKFSLNSEHLIGTLPQNAKRLKLQARLSLRGTPAPASGDFESQPQWIRLGDKDVVVVVSRQVP